MLSGNQNQKKLKRNIDITAKESEQYSFFSDGIKVTVKFSEDSKGTVEDHLRNYLVGMRRKM